MPLAPLTTLRVGPVARRMITCTTTEQVVAALSGLRDEGADPLVLGRRIQRRDRRPPDRSDRGAAGECANHHRRQHDSCRGRCGVGCRGAGRDRGRPRRAGMSVGDSGVGRGHPGAERRGLRRRGGRHHHPGAVTRPSHWRTALGARVRPRLRLPHQHPQASAARNAGADRGGSGVRARRDGPERAAAVRRTDDRAGRRGASVPTRRGSATPCWRCAAARAWCWMRPTTTPGAWGRSSPTRWSPADGSRSCRPRSTGPVPNYPAEGGVKLAAGWLVEHAGFGKGFPGDGAAGQIVRQACAGVDQPRHRHQRRRHRLGAPGPRRGGRRVRHPAGARTGADRRCDLILRI